VDGIYKRWGIPQSDAKKWASLKERLKLICGDDLEISEGTLKGIAFDLGVSVDLIGFWSDYTHEWYLSAHRMIDRAATPFELAQVIEALVKNVDSYAAIMKLIVKLLDDSDSGIRLSNTRAGWRTYPAGEKLLDRELVEAPLSFLTGKSLEEYTKSLEHYSNHKWEEAAEKTRRALEEYLRAKLKTTKGLESSIKDLGGRLKKTTVPTHLRNTVTNVLHSLDTNYNESSKHNSKTYGEVETEFLVYQVGLLMRILDRIDISKA